MLLWVVACVCFAQAPIRLEPKEVATGIFVVMGAGGDPGPENDGASVNVGFVIGPRGVVVIDTGPHRRYGEALRAAIRRITPLPIRLVINTHAHSENVLGNASFARHRVPILATERTRDLMRERCPECVKNYSKALGAGRMQGTEIVLPDRAIERPTSIRLAGVRLKLVPLGWAHTEGDLAVYDERSGVLFAGGAIYAREIPYMREAHTQGWLDALAILRRLPLRRIVPGAGPVSGPEALESQERYLRALLTSARAKLGRGTDLASAAADMHIPEFSGWAHYAQRHPLNVQHVLAEIEREAWQRHE